MTAESRGSQRMDGLARRVETIGRPCAVDHVAPAAHLGGVIVACPHSGRYYPPELLTATRLDRFTLRRSEDAFVDQLFAAAPTYGADLLMSVFARAFVDVNRAADELDPLLIDGLAASDPGKVSERVKAGLGVIPRTVGDGINIYHQSLDLPQAKQRLDEVHVPWHRAVEAHMAGAIKRNGAALLLDCHSMPGSASGDPPFDVVLGDRFGSSCAPIIVNEAMACLRGAGLRVSRNDPYAGGYATKRHGRPHERHHALQIEINRSLYMVEGAMTPRPCFAAISEMMCGLVERLVVLSLDLAPKTTRKMERSLTTS
jgi:N-formylglutamate amidohydrolase